MDRRRHRSLDFVLQLGLAFVPGMVGTPFVDRDWYARLSKPRWAPPPEVFGPVWTSLYASQAVAAWLVDGEAPRSATPKRLYVGQLGLNALWTPVFFGARRPGIALRELAALWVSAALTARRFYRIRRPAGLLFLPYLAWLAFAGALNAAIWRRGRAERSRARSDGAG